MKYKKLLKTARKIVNELTEEYDVQLPIDIYIVDNGQIHINFSHPNAGHYHREYPAEKASLKLLQEQLEKHLLCKNLSEKINFPYNHFFRNFTVMELVDIYMYLEKVAKKGTD